MERTPDRKDKTKTEDSIFTTDHKENNLPSTRLKKPPPITPRRFNRFFTPRPRNADAAVKTSRKALKVLQSSAINARSNNAIHTKQYDLEIGSNTPRGTKRKLSVIVEASTQSSPTTRIDFAHTNQDIRSSPTIPERRSPLHGVRRDLEDYEEEEEEAETDVEDELDEEEAFERPSARIMPYRMKTNSGRVLSTRLSGHKTSLATRTSHLWQHETGNFYSSPLDVNSSFSSQPVALPFSIATCNTNPIFATGDEDGTIRIIDSSVDNEDGLTKTFLQMRPHDNAIMDLEFSEDDAYLATACGDQSCQIIDMQTQTTLYTLGGHRCSVKRVAFQPGSGNKVLASCGRDGQLNFWDLRSNDDKDYRNSKDQEVVDSMAAQSRYLLPTHGIREAHTAGSKSAKAINSKVRPNLVPGRMDFSVTCLSFLGKSRSHLLATASEVDTTVKVWDIRTNYGSNRRAPAPLSFTEQPRSHAYHRCFGVTSLVINTDESRMYALSRDHTVYAYSTAHLILGSGSNLSSSSKPPKRTDGSKNGLGPLYGFRHPSLKVQSFWPRLAMRTATESNTELLAVGSTEDCVVLFPTNEAYLDKSTRNIGTQDHLRIKLGGRPGLRSRDPKCTTSFASRTVMPSANNDEGLPIYHHGTPLIRGHDKEVTSLAWTSEGSLVTASDDYTVRCWREDATNARRMRDQGEKNGERWNRGWADVAVADFDEEY